MKSLALLVLLAGHAQADVLHAPVDAFQGTVPWIVTATTITFAFVSTQPVMVTNIPTVVVGSSVTVNQGTTPWDVSGSTISIAGGLSLSTGANNIGTVSGSSVTAFQGGQWSVGAAQQGPYNISVTSGVITVLQGTTPWNVSGSTIIVSGGVVLSTGTNNIGTVSGSSVVAFQGGFWSVGASQQGPFNVSVASGALAVSQAGPYSVSVTSGSINTTGSTITVNIGATGGLALDSTVAQNFRQGQTIGNSSFTIYGTTIPVTQAGAWNVGASQQGPFAVSVTSGSITAAATQSGPWVVTIGSGSVNAAVAITSLAVYNVPGTTLTIQGAVAASQAGPYNVSVSSGNIGVAQQGPFAVSVTSGDITANIGNIGAFASTTFTITFVSTQPVHVTNMQEISQTGTFTVTVTSGSIFVVNSGTSTVYQGSIPWIVTGGTFSVVDTTIPVTQSGQWSVGASQQGPFVVSVTSGNINVGLAITSIAVYNVPGTTLAIAGAVASSQAGPMVVSVSSGFFTVAGGSVTAFQGGQWSVGASQAGPMVVSVTSGNITAQVSVTSVAVYNVIGTTLAIQGAVAASQAGPFNVSITSGIVQAFQGGPLVVSIASGNLNVGVAFTSMAVYNVSGTSLSITGPVLASQSGPWHVSVDSGNINVGVAFTSAAVYSVVGTSLSITGQVLAYQGGPMVVSVTSGNINVGLAITSIAVYNVPGTTLAIAGAVGASQQGPWNLIIASGNLNVGVAFTSVAVYNVPGTSLTVAAIQVSTWNVNANLRDGAGDPIAATPMRDGSGEEALNVFVISGSSQVAIPIERAQALARSYFAVSSNFVTFANSAENPLFLFVNPSTGTKAAFLDNHRISLAGTNLGNGSAEFRIYRSPVVTSSGTALGIFPGDVNSGAVSQMQAFVSPTASSFGTLVYSATSAGGTIVMPLNQSRIFRPGTKFLVTIDNPANNFSDDYDIEWSEE